MQLRKLKRFLKASSVLFLAALMAAAVAPVTRAQEFVSFNHRFINFPGGLGDTFALPFVQGSDVIAGDFNGDTNSDIIVGDFNSNQIAVYLGRGNGSFVRTALRNTGTVGRVTSLAASGNVIAAALDNPLGTQDSIELFHVNADGSTTLIDDVDIDAANTVVGGNAQGGANPVSVAFGNLNASSSNLNVVFAASGVYDGNAADGFIGVISDAGGNPTLTQLIGGGQLATSYSVLENDGDQSGSLYDAQDFGLPAGVNVYPNAAGVPLATQNRRLFKIPRLGTDVTVGLAPRLLSVGDTAHKQDGALDVVFAATDYGSAGGGVATPLNLATTPASPIPAGEGATFVLINDSTSIGKIRRNARRLTDDYNYTNIPSGTISIQDGLILRSGNIPDATAIGDFNGDNRNDIVTANYASGTVAVYQSGLVNPSSGAGNTTVDFGSGAVPTSPQINSFPNTNTTFVTTGGAPNTVYVKDLTADGRVDIVGTTFVAGDFSTYTLLNAASGAGVFTTGTLPLGSTRARANSSGFALAIGTNFNPSPTDPTTYGTLFDYVTTPLANELADSLISVRYGFPVTGFATPVFGLIPLSQFVGVVDGRINTDNLPDVAIADAGTDSIFVVYNTAAGLPSTTTRVTPANLTDLFPFFETGKLTSIDVGDVDQDGTTDIVAGVDGLND